MAPNAGYIRLNNWTADFVQCPNPNACLAANLTNQQGTCAEGYSGIGCGKCSSGFFNS